MNKPLTIISAIVLGSVIAGAAQAAEPAQQKAEQTAAAAAAPKGLPGAGAPISLNSPTAYISGPNAPKGFEGNLAPVPVAKVLAEGYDKQYVIMKGSLTRYLGDDKYEFSDGKTAIVVELDDKRSWDHIRKDQQLLVSGKVDREWEYVKVELDSAQPVTR